MTTDPTVEKVATAIGPDVSEIVFSLDAGSAVIEKIARAAIAALAPVWWQKIESAPKDGEVFLACRAGDNLYRIISFDDDGQPPEYPWRTEEATIGIHRDWPTHWMRLPSIPGPRR